MRNLFSRAKKSKKYSGFTLIEILIVIAIISILVAMVIVALRPFNQDLELNNSADHIINSLKLAQSKTLASEQASSYGIYFDITTNPHRYILFKGSDYASRDADFDQIIELSNFVELFDIDFGSGTEVVFDRITGITANSGSVSVRLKQDTTKIKTIYIETSGSVSYVPFPVVNNGRLEDSRHVHVVYSRVIDTATENLVLTFDGGVIENIIIADNMESGQINWEGEVDVAGETQVLKIHTHNLNSPGTLFSIHRDRRYNNKSLEISINGDSSGYLISYSADGMATNKTSIFVSDIIWQ